MVQFKLSASLRFIIAAAAITGTPVIARPVTGSPGPVIPPITHSPPQSSSAAPPVDHRLNTIRIGSPSPPPPAYPVHRPHEPGRENLELLADTAVDERDKRWTMFTNVMAAQRRMKIESKPLKRVRRGRNVTGRNLCGDAWRLEHPGGTADEFKVYYDNLPKEDKEKWMAEAVKVKSSREMNKKMKDNPQ